VIGGEKLRLYETIFVLDPSLDDHNIQSEIKKVEELIFSHKGRLVRTEKWGMKRFAYPIRKKSQGYYTLIYFEGDGNIPKELERIYELNESCLRYLTVLSEKKPEQLKAEEKEDDLRKEVSPSE
jgi:small subunit ribosomal protein S6